ncbi:5-(carboxyamino)imidazole ribonucleotide synthase [Candidatus Nitrosotalea okcheonensis]|uniref:5-(carboxyamino)imidazole ribonucleotide synthase n=1 Tax=Candidatus Nitrosotalea okcheonensis TaxID=1903276 RepID=UPI0013000CD8|nr:5-(carboxyamino)imidazole ribonucleotide synthase [Candidatus Nitrosotalea okcheonensis]
MTKNLGIIGGGQLGMMLTEAAKNMPEHISDVIILDPTKNCPASIVGAKQIVADFKDKNAIVELSLQSDIITYEIESGDSEVLESLHGEVSINPSPNTLKIIQDKYIQKQFLRKNNIPVADFDIIESLDDLEKKITDFQYPALLKARRDAYDGRGNFKIENSSQIETAYQKFSGRHTMIEKFVDFKMEVSVIAARNIHGEIATYQLVENIHKDNILEYTIAPARVDSKISSEADKIAKKTMDVLQGAGVFGIEMFVTKDDKVLINEIAPRVHNSGHHTLQSSDTSQFEQHLRAILGLPLGSTKLRHATIMCNILGPKDFIGRYKPITLEQKGVYLKMYHKNDARPQRKLGHFNVVDESDTNDVKSLLERTKEIKNSIQFISQD